MLCGKSQLTCSASVAAEIRRDVAQRDEMSARHVGGELAAQAHRRRLGAQSASAERRLGKTVVTMVKW